MTDVPPPDELLALAARAARAGARLLLDRLGDARADVGTKSTSTDMVTEVDRAAEAAVVEAILAERTDDAVVAEEGTARAGGSGVEWVVDPLDGTTNYLYGLPGFAVSVAARVGGEVVAGVVADPLHREVYRAARGRGATVDGRPLRRRPHTELATALVATGFSYEPERRGRQAEVLTRVLPRIRDIRRGGAAAVDLCWVAANRVDAFYERGLQPWDFAAGALVASEAGASVGDLADGAPSPEFVLAAAPGLYGPLADLLASSGAAGA